MRFKSKFDFGYVMELRILMTRDEGLRLAELIQHAADRTARKAKNKRGAAKRQRIRESKRIASNKSSKEV